MVTAGYVLLNVLAYMLLLLFLLLLLFVLNIHS